MKVKTVHEAIIRTGSGAYTPSKGTVKAEEILTATMQIDGWSYIPSLEGWINDYHLERIANS